LALVFGQVSPHAAIPVPGAAPAQSQTNSNQGTRLEADAVAEEIRQDPIRKLFRIADAKAKASEWTQVLPATSPIPQDDYSKGARGCRKALFLKNSIKENNEKADNLAKLCLSALAKAHPRGGCQEQGDDLRRSSIVATPEGMIPRG
jgi:hypothetical protein